MPWINREKCAGCGICVDRCPSKAILMDDGKAQIHMEDCIRCGVCHAVCSMEAVRHDSEKIPDEVKANVEMTRKCMEACVKALGEEKEKWKCLERMKKHFKKEKYVAERTLEELEKLK